MTISTTRQKYKRAYLPGGTMMNTVGKWNSKICGEIFDSHRMGRWSGTSYQVTATKKLHIITGYRVCPKNNQTSAASLSTYAQQKIMLIGRGIMNTCP
jgi:hypothetical protein